jgi:hypothetical protein
MNTLSLIYHPQGAFSSAPLSHVAIVCFEDADLAAAFENNVNKRVISSYLRR